MPGKFTIGPSACIPLAFGIVAILVQVAGWGEAVRYERMAVERGEIWRLLSGHFAHLGWPHLWMNVGGILAVTLLFGRYMTAAVWLAASILSAIAVGAGLYLFDPGVGWYVGLSGILHGLLIAGALVSIRHDPLTGGGLIILLLAKVLWEQFVGPMPGSESAAGGPVVVQAHLYGALGGVITGATSLGACRT